MFKIKLTPKEDSSITIFTHSDTKIDITQVTRGRVTKTCATCQRTIATGDSAITFLARNKKHLYKKT